MTQDDRQLLARIEALAIDPPGVQLRFVDRLARENGWDVFHAVVVDHEYRRFLFLAATAVDPVTPSDAVDQVWHLHLAYTRSYWDDLCGRILGRPLHHGPTAGGPAEDTRYRRQYQATLDRYAMTFGEVPPAAIWPPVAERFTSRFVRVDRRRTWLVPNRVAAIGALLPLAGCALMAAKPGEAAMTWALVGFLVSVFVLGTILGALANRRSCKRDKREDGGGCGSGCGDDSDGGGHGCGSGGDGCGGGCGGD